MTYTIKSMTPADLDMALDWARAEGWNPGLGDAKAFYAQDPTGFLMGWLDDEPIASISVVKYGSRFSFLGLYIVRAQWRGKGYGRAIWDAGIESAGARTIGLDGVVEQQANYLASGFVVAHRNARWGGMVKTRTKDTSVRSITREVVAAVEAFDSEHFPAPRERFLTTWLAASPMRRSFGYFEDDRVLGYGTIRRSVEGAKIGPLFARSPEIANALLNTTAAEAIGEPIFIDIPAPNEIAGDMARRAGLAPGFETARMYRGDAPLLPLPQIFGITSLELG